MIPRDKRLAIAKELQKWFRGRTDVVGVSNDHGFAPEQLDEPLSAERVANEHLAGKHCFAIYLLRTDGNVWFSCLDFDDKQRRPDATIRAKVDSVVACLQQVGIKPLVELSQSGRGVHVWVFFKSAKPAWQVRAFWRVCSNTSSCRWQRRFIRDKTRWRASPWATQSVCRSGTNHDSLIRVGNGSYCSRSQR